MKKILNTFLYFLITFITVLLVAFSLKGDRGNPIYFQNELDNRVGGPFESSSSSSRYALVKSIVEYRSIFFDSELAKFASPDLIEHDGKFSTLFTPGVSFMAIPFYVLGKQFGLPQFFTYLTTVVFALINVFLIAKIITKFRVNKYLGILCGLIFAFATPALAYANTLTQHHVSTALVLMSILNALNKRTLLNNVLFGILLGAGALVDIPNVIFMIPIGIYILSKHFRMENLKGNINIYLNPTLMGLVAGLVPLVFLFAWYNYQTTGSYTKLAQSIGRSSYFASEEHKKIAKADNQDNPKPTIPFKTRNQLRGFYILLISNERGIFYYSPIVLIGLLGLVIAYKYRLNIILTVLLTSVILVNLLLYSMFGDPWGGWSFGPRYLIPSIALLCIAAGVSFQKLHKNFLFVGISLALLLYSVGVNVLGASTTNLVPPKVEAVNLASPIPYTYKYNFQLADKNQSSALIYNLYLRDYLNAKTYIYIYGLLILAVIVGLYLMFYFDVKKIRRKYV